MCAQDEEIIHSVKNVVDVINQTTAQAERGDHRLNVGTVKALNEYKILISMRDLTCPQLTYTSKRLLWVTDASSTTNFSNFPQMFNPVHRVVTKSHCC